jgi:sigma-B regulation protein RsbU (phosphoserine phosphatase)
VRDGNERSSSMSRRWRVLITLLVFSITPLVVLTPLILQERWLLTGIVAIAVIVTIILTAFWGSRAMTRPLQIMIEAVQRLAEGDFSARIDLATGDERDMLARAFNEMVPQLEDRMNICQALQVAQEVQQNLLPKEIPSLPGFDMAATTVYCEQTGGDYFDFFPCGEDCEGVAVVVGDVTGHGVAAALLMTTARAFLRMRAVQPGTIAEVVTSVNQQLTVDTYETGSYMTLFYLAIDQTNRTLQWVRAGHDPAIFYDTDTGQFEELVGSGMALGVDKGWQYEANEKRGLRRGQIIFLGTDGIWEAHDADGQMFGKQRLYEIIRANAGKPAEIIKDETLKALRDFSGNVAQDDDVTIVVIKGT